MRILAIRGENIASLADRFEIDLTAEPLGTAGLFAITGQTGAGKSSILDAMCLALYGNCPRLSSGGGKDKVTDADGTEIQSSDPRLGLRRGAAEGMAEVDFLAIDGKAYRATWGARRARNKADGKLQGVSRSLLTIADGQIIETQIMQVNARVTDLTALSYDEFRRTVLLSQGDFDAFLRAETNDRAALLEKVTGTSLYRDISVRVHQKTTAAKEVVDRLQLRRAETSAMTDEEREAVETHIAALQNAAQQSRSERQRIDIGIRHFRSLAEAETAVIAGTQAVTDREASHTEAAPQRTELEAIDAAAALRPQFDRFARARTAVQRCETAVATALADAATSDENAKTAAANAKAAQDNATAQERIFKEFAGQWDKASDLDTRIDAAADEAVRTADDVAQAEAAVADTAQTLDTREAELAQAMSTLTAATSAKPVAFAPLAPHWPVIAQALDDRKALTLAAADADRTITVSQTAATALAAKANDIASRLTEATIACDTAAKSAEQLHTQVNALAEKTGDDRLDALTGSRDSIEAAIRIHSAWAQADDTIAAQSGQIATAKALHVDAEHRASSAQTALTTAKAQVEALRTPTLHAEMALSDAAREMRAHLVDGSPCPVCGATEHQAVADHALADLAAQLQAQLAKARDDQDEAQVALDLARADMTKASQSMATATEALAKAERDRDQACADYPATVPPLGPDTAMLLQGLLADAQSALTDLRQTRAQANDLRDQAAAQARQRDALTSQRDAIMAEQHACQRDHDRALAETTSAEHNAADLERRIAAVDSRLSPHLTAEQIKDAETAQYLAQMHDYWTKAEAAELAARAAIASAEPAIALAHVAHVAAKADREKRTSQLSERHGKLAALRHERAGLLGGEATGEHRTRVNKAREAAHADARLAEAAANVAQTSAVQKAEALAHARALAREAQTELNETTAALAGQDIDTLSSLFARSPDEVDQLRKHLRSLDDAIIAAKAQLAARQEQLDVLRALPMPDETLPALEAALAALEQADAERQQQIGGARAQLAADTARRAALGSLDHEIAAAKAHFDVWDAVNRAVGSANGDKFARHAQKITLDLLVEKANLHLAQLRPRYRLQSSGAELGLHVIDRDMADELRSTRSLSGGERFLISLALALALSTMGSRGGLAGTLFIDEGFGSLDGESLDLAIDALEALQSQGRTVGVISHVEALKDRIPVQLRVKHQGNGRSTISMHAPHFAAT